MATAKRAAKAKSKSKQQPKGRRSPDAPAPELVPQPHGGALVQGTNFGNKGGPGRPPYALRDRLRGSFDQRVAVIEAIADGECVERAELPLAVVLQHAHCPTCGEQLQAKPDVKPDDLVLLRLEVKRSATASERLKGMDLLAKYGLGTAAGIPLEVVREKLASTIDLLRSALAPAVSEPIIAQMRERWA